MLSEDKITHLTHVLLKALLDKDIIDITEDEGAVRKSIKRSIIAQLQVGEEMDAKVRQKIESLKKGVPEGSPEWDILYSKYFQEEEIKKGIGG